MGSAICSSSRFSCRLTADSERPIFRAAAAKLPVSTTASKLRKMRQIQRLHVTSVWLK
jgi:hypothetical protein